MPQKPSTLDTGLDRLERVIALRGLASRREAKSLIVKGAVKVNGKVIRIPGIGISPSKDKVEITSLEHQNKQSFLVYKPRGIETNKTSSLSRDLHDEFPKLNNLNPIGRLDKDSEGLIIMSDDGTLTKALTNIDCKVGKEYLVTVREQITDKNIEMMSKGISLDGVMTKQAKVKKTSPNTFTIVLHEGRKHQIRRMCDACRLTIERLVRIKIGNLSIGKMRSGSVREITSTEVKELKS